jgi:hypothetical protein
MVSKINDNMNIGFIWMLNDILPPLYKLNSRNVVELSDFLYSILIVIFIKYNISNIYIKIKNYELNDSPIFQI